MIQADYVIYTLSNTGVIKEVLCPMLITEKDSDGMRAIKELYVPEQPHDFLILYFPNFFKYNGLAYSPYDFEDYLQGFNQGQLSIMFSGFYTMPELALESNHSFAACLTSEQQKDESLFQRRAKTRYYVVNNPNVQDPVIEPEPPLPYQPIIAMRELNGRAGNWSIGYLHSNEPSLFVIYDHNYPDKVYTQEFEVSVNNPSDGFEVKYEGNGNFKVEWFNSNEDVSIHVWHADTQQSTNILIHRLV